MDGDGSSRLLLRRIARARAALTLRRGIRSLPGLLCWAAAGVVIATLLARAGWLPDRAALVAGFLGSVAILLAAADAFRYRLDDAALALDRRLGLDERTITALQALRRGERGPLARQVIREAGTALPANPLGLFAFGIGPSLLALMLAIAAVLGARALPARGPAPEASAPPAPVPPPAAHRRLLAQAKELESDVRRAGRELELRAVARARAAAEGLVAAPARRTQALRNLSEARRLAAAARKSSPLARSLPHFDAAVRSLGATAETRELARALDSADAERIARAMDDLARSAESGGFEARSMAELARGLEQLARALDAAGEIELGRLTHQAAAAAGRGDGEAVGRALRDLKAAGAGNWTAMAGAESQLNNRLADIMREAEGALGLRSSPLTEADYGVGSTADEAPAFQVSGSRRLRDRELPLSSTKTADYQARHASRQLESGRLEPAAAGGVSGDEGPLTYIELRAPAGPVRLRRARDVAPGAAVPAAEEALSREEIPPGYRAAVKSYFDRGEAAPAASEEP